jgi:hypothetical protein
MGIYDIPFPKSSLAFPLTGDLVTRPNVPLLEPILTLTNITSLTLHCDVTSLSVTSADMDVTVVYLDSLPILQRNLRNLVIYLTLPKVTPLRTPAILIMQMGTSSSGHRAITTSGTIYALLTIDYKPW